MLNKTLVPQSVAREIQSMIQNGSLKPGEKIPSQREFSQKFGISRASLREALLTLETLGLLKTEAGRGTFVSGGRLLLPITWVLGHILTVTPFSMFSRHASCWKGRLRPFRRVA